ncbi:MAG: ligase-associated DNA damage response endonuclease PdeM [Alphaproteobacteria bacterium]|nr:ligase-associated DNA damage response endonuclease PdeM [Alphaproteobacteria bacterium]
MLVNGARLLPDPAGGLYWPDREVLVVADLHFEKGSAYAARGALLPPYDTRATLAQLGALIGRHEPETVICLGDSFHDSGAGQRLGQDEIAELEELEEGRNWIWIAGNHDPAPPAWLGGRIEHEVAMGPLSFRHEPRPGSPAGEVAGHLHPKAAVVVKGRRLVRRCFATDGLRLVLPAFGAYTGGLDVLDRAFRPYLGGDFRAFMLGRDEVYPVASSKLVAIAPNGAS